MNSNPLLLAMSDVSAKYVKQADPTNFQTRKKTQFIQRMASAAASLILIAAISVFAITSAVNRDPAYKGNPNSGRIRFYYQGNTYLWHPDNIIWTDIPEEYVYLGDIVNVWEDDCDEDFEGNIDGQIYISSLNPNYAFIRIDGSLYEDGITKYLLCTVRNPDNTDIEDGFAPKPDSSEKEPNPTEQNKK